MNSFVYTGPKSVVKDTFMPFGAVVCRRVIHLSSLYSRRALEPVTCSSTETRRSVCMLQSLLWKCSESLHTCGCFITSDRWLLKRKFSCLSVCPMYIEWCLVHLAAYIAPTVDAVLPSMLNVRFVLWLVIERVRFIWFANSERPSVTGCFPWAICWPWWLVLMIKWWPMR